MTLTVTSSSFTTGAAIPTRYSGEGEDLSPALSWKGAPAGVRSYAVVCDDPDAPSGTWVHWLLWNIPATATAIPEHLPTSAALPDGSRQGTTDFKRTGYGGPLPPHGSTHRYFFHVYALDIALSLAPGARRSQLDAAMKSHILAQGELMGTYSRR